MTMPEPGNTDMIDTIYWDAASSDDPNGHCLIWPADGTRDQEWLLDVHFPDDATAARFKPALLAAVQAALRAEA